MKYDNLQSLEVIKDIYNIDQLLSGKEYIRELVHRLANALQVKYVLVGHAVEPERRSIRADVMWANGTWHDGVTYDLDQTPCEHVLCGTRVTCYNDKVYSQFPKDQMLQDLKIQSYMGAPLLHSDGRLFGLLVIMDDQPFKNVAVHTAVVEFFAARIGTEYGRIAAEESLKKINENLEQLVNERTRELQEAFASLQKTQRQLISQEKLATIGRITFGIAHELKNPLNIIINAAELLKDDDLNAEERIHAAGMIHQHGLRANEIITSMLKQARQEDSPLVETADVSALLDRALDMFLRSVGDLDLKGRLQTELHITSGITAPLLDAPGLERVFINIIDNALYALKEKTRLRPEHHPTLKVELTRNGDICLLKIRDNGVGIPIRHLTRVCEEFYTTKPAGEGTGLGLWFAKQNIEKNRGSFTIESLENEFTEITIELPSLPSSKLPPT